MTCRLWVSDKGIMLKWIWIPPWVLIKAYKAWLPLHGPQTAIADSAWCSHLVGCTWKNLLRRRSGAVVFGLRSSIRQLQEQGCGTGRAQLGDERNTRRTRLGLHELGVMCRLLLASHTQILCVTRRFFFFVLVSLCLIQFQKASKNKKHTYIECGPMCVLFLHFWTIVL